MLPDDNVNTFLVSVDAGANATLTKTNELLGELGATIQRNPYVTDLKLYLGESAPEDFAPGNGEEPIIWVICNFLILNRLNGALGGTRTPDTLVRSLIL